MPGAGNAAVFDGAESHGGVGVRASIFDGVNFSLVSDQSNAVALQCVGATGTFCQFTGTGDFSEVWGGSAHGGAGFQAENPSSVLSCEAVMPESRIDLSVMEWSRFANRRP